MKNLPSTEARRDFLHSEIILESRVRLIKSRKNDIHQKKIDNRTNNLQKG